MRRAVLCVAFSPCGGTMVAGRGDGMVFVHDMRLPTMPQVDTIQVRDAGVHISIHAIALNVHHVALSIHTIALNITM